MYLQKDQPVRLYCLFSFVHCIDRDIPKAVFFFFKSEVQQFEFNVSTCARCLHTEILHLFQAAKVLTHWVQKTEYLNLQPTMCAKYELLEM